MINLMPTANKQSIFYARRNTMLIRWVIAIGIAAAGLVLITFGSLFYLRRDTSALRANIEESKTSLTAQNEAETLKRAEEMSGNLKLVVDVLGKEILFSKLLQQIGLVMPPGTILESLSLTNALAGSGIDLSIGSQDYETGTRAQVNLNDKTNGIFEKADLLNINCGNAEGRPAGYPCVVEIRALFLKDNPFLLINRQGGDD